MIAYRPGDPGEGGAVRQITPHPDPVAPRVGFAVRALPAQAVYDLGNRDGVAWSAREAALAALAAWEDCTGALRAWQGGARRALPLVAVAGTDLNAYYDRASISFFETVIDGATLYSGASQDVVAHEAGHAILDALRPDLWDAALMEVAAFHEGFGDCIAVLTALADKATRVALLKADPRLERANPVEATAEALSAGIARRYGATHNAAAPRRALNDFRWNFPVALPDDGKPGVLINEMHSLGQLVSGCFYRVLQGVFARTAGGEAGLWQAAKVAAWLLGQATVKAPVRPRFMQSVGRTMLLVDQAAYKGANTPAIRAAYAHHGIDIGAATALAPQAPLGRAAPGFARGGDRPVGAAGARGVAAMLGTVDGAVPDFRRVEFGDRAVAVASVPRAASLGDLDPRLAGAVGVAPHEAFVGTAPGGGMALLGAVEPGAAVDGEIRDFVATLLRRDDIEFGKARSGGAGVVGTPESVTHRVRRHRLERIGFACGCTPR